MKKGRAMGPLWEKVLAAPLALLIMAIYCGRKDVDRHGQIKLRGERPVAVEGKRPGDLVQKGIASWYGNPYHGRKTSNGEVYDMWKRTAAHKTLPFGTVVKVVNLENGQSVKVRINDRGPFIRGRVIDLSRRAADDIDMVGTGLAKVALYLASHGRDRGPATRARTANESGFWTVQVGSFRDLGRAKAMTRRMRDYDEGVWTEKTGDLTRVRVGRFPTKAGAARLALRLNRDGFDSWLVFVEDG